MRPSPACGTHGGNVGHLGTRVNGFGLCLRQQKGGGADARVSVPL
jgi:hypothetical protein